MTLIVKPYEPAGVELDVVTVKVIVEPLVPLGVNEGVMLVPLVTASDAEVKAQVTPVGVPPAQVSNMLSATGVDVPVSVKVMV